MASCQRGQIRARSRPRRGCGQLGERAAFPHESPVSPESLLVGGLITKHEAAVQQANPLTYLDSDDPPFLILHGRNDPIVPIEQNELLYEALKAAGIEATFYEFHELGHGFGFPQMVEQFLDRQLRN